MPVFSANDETVRAIVYEGVSGVRGISDVR